MLNTLTEGIFWLNLIQKETGSCTLGQLHNTNLNTAGGHNQETHSKGALLIQAKTLM